MASIQIIYDGKPLTLPRSLFSRTVWAGAALVALNIYDQIGDPVAFLAQFGIMFNEQVLHWANVAGALLAIYFRVRPKQSLGNLQQPLNAEEMEALKAAIRKEIEGEPKP